MKTIVMLMLALSLAAAPAEARHNRYYDYSNGYTYSNNGYATPSNVYVDPNGNAYSGYYGYGYSYDNYRRKVRSHKRRRNVLLGVGAVGLITGSRAATAIGLGGVVANELIDRRHRDW